MNTPDEATAIAPALEQPEIPDKLYFRIGEVSRLAGIKPYVLRFWETEFPLLGPKKSRTGQRMYRRKDVELVLDASGCDLSAATLPLVEPLRGASGSDVGYPLILVATELSPRAARPLTRCRQEMDEL